MLAEDTHQVARPQSLGDRNLLDETRHLFFPGGKHVRRGNRGRQRLLRALRRQRAPHPRRPHARGKRLAHAPAMVVVHAYRGPLMSVPDDMVAQRAQAAQRVHRGDRLVHDGAARHDADVPGAPHVPGHDGAAAAAGRGRVRADVREDRVGRDVQRLLLLPARVVPAPAVADDVEHDQPVGEVVGEGARRGVRRAGVRHRVGRDGEVAGGRWAWGDVGEVQGEDGAARGVDVLDD